MQSSLQRCVILLKNAFAHFYNNAECFQDFVLITHDHGEKLWYEHEVNAHVQRLFVFLLNCKSWWNKFHRPLTPRFVVNMNKNYHPHQLYMFISITQGHGTMAHIRYVPEAVLTILYSFFPLLICSPAKCGSVLGSGVFD